MSRARVPAIVLVVVLGVLGAGAAASEERERAVLSLDEYRAELARIADAVRADNSGEARELARSLSDSRVETPAGIISVDRSLLTPLLTVDAGPRATVGLAGRIERSIGELDRVMGAAPGEGLAPPDRARLDALRRAQEVDGPKPGGETDLPELAPAGFWDSIGAALKRFGDWLLDVLDRLFEWLKKLWPAPAGPGRRQPVSIRGIVAVTVAMVAALLLLLAIRARRLRGAVAPEEAAESEPLESTSRDEDPLSREASEWQRHAAELARRGRLREAIRAWYHAALVTLFRSGALGYRRGTTNWEYVASVGPERAWRGRFTELTRGFEREWYGGERSSAEAYAEFQRESRALIAAIAPERTAA